jgi:hypothetical protein
MHDAYVAAGGPGRIERPGQFTMAIAQLGHIGELSCPMKSGDCGQILTGKESTLV